MLPNTGTRVSAHTGARINDEIRQRALDSVRYHAAHPYEIDDRLDELDREWDIERMLEANASTLSLIGLGLAVTHDRRWLALPIAVVAFLLQHAIQGWCPPVPVMRRMGFRTADEIALERYALKALRGDFDHLSEDGGPQLRAERAMTAMRR